MGPHFGRSRRARPSSAWRLGAACLGVALAAGCDGVGPEPALPPGLVVLTPAVGGVADGAAAVIVATERPARVSLRTSDGRPLAAGRTGTSPTALVFEVPGELAPGSYIDLTVDALSTTGLAESATATLVGLTDLRTGEVAGGPFRGVAASRATGALLGDSALLFVDVSGAVIRSVPVPFIPRAVAADRDNDEVLLGGDSREVRVYGSDGELAGSFDLPPYESSSAGEVRSVNALHVNGALVAAATEQGMAIVDRGSAQSDAGLFCRSRSAEAATITDEPLDKTMWAVVVTARERVVAGGYFLNVSEPVDTSDDGTCTPPQVPMSNRGTRVVYAPEGRSTPWRVTAMALDRSTLWVGRAEGGIVVLPVDFAQTGVHGLPDTGVTFLGEGALPVPIVLDLAPGSPGTVHAVLRASGGDRGGLAIVTEDGLTLWVDMATLGSMPEAVDVEPIRGIVWVATTAGFALFSAPAP